MTTTTEQTPREKITATMAALGLTISAEFVPFSQSRNAKPREDGKVWRSLNWRVTLLKWPTHSDGNGKPILTTDYGAGEAHCPAHKNPQRFAPGQGSANVDKRANDQRIIWECEHGMRAGHCSDSAVGNGWHVSAMKPVRKIEPDACDVIASLVMDSDVLDAGTFEEWAGDLGYDADSRKAEATYRACLEIALKLRNGIGEAGLQRLRDACQDY